MGAIKYLYQLASKRVDAKERTSKTFYNSNGDSIGDTVEKVMTCWFLLIPPVAVKLASVATPNSQQKPGPARTPQREKASKATCHANLLLLPFGLNMVMATN